MEISHYYSKYQLRLYKKCWVTIFRIFYTKYNYKKIHWISFVVPWASYDYDVFFIYIYDWMPSISVEIVLKILCFSHYQCKNVYDTAMVVKYSLHVLEPNNLSEWDLFDSIDTTTTWVLIGSNICMNKLQIAQFWQIFVYVCTSDRALLPKIKRIS